MEINVGIQLLQWAEKVGISASSPKNGDGRLLDSRERRASCGGLTRPGCRCIRPCRLCASSQRAAGHGRAGLRRDVPGEAPPAPVRSVRVRLPPEHAQSGAGIHGHQRDPPASPSKGQPQSTSERRRGRI